MGNAMRVYRTDRIQCRVPWRKYLSDQRKQERKSKQNRVGVEVERRTTNMEIMANFDVACVWSKCFQYGYFGLQGYSLLDENV